MHFLLPRVVSSLVGTAGCKALLPSQLVKEREVQLCDTWSVFRVTNSVHKSSCLENYYQTGLQDSRKNMLLELFSQIINENCYSQLRTKV